MSKPVAKSAAAKKATSTGPSYESMIKSAILAHPEESRAGLSRPTIKKYILQKYPAAAKVSEATFSNHVSKAILKGTEKKVFTLPKGPSGKVKLAPSAKTAVKKPAAAKKPAAKPAAKKVKKTTTTAKKPAAKKTKSSTATKAKKPVAKKPAAKKVAPKKKAAPKKA